MDDECFRVVDWLTAAECEKGDAHGDSPGIDEKERPPTTPSRPLRPYSQIEAFSPTDTAFSGPGESIFDGADVQPDTPITPRYRIGFDGHGDIKCQAGPPTTSYNIDPASPLATESLESYEPSVTGSTTSLHKPLTHNPSLSVQPTNLSSPRTGRLTQIVSCLQCTLIDLPCSRTLPACTRCVRRGEGRGCIVRRRQYVDETRGVIGKGGMGYAWEPVVLHVNLEAADRDEEKKARVRKMEDLMRMWHDKQDKQNWILPSIEQSPRGGFKKFQSWWQATGPGEGKGAVRVTEVQGVDAMNK